MAGSKDILVAGYPEDLLKGLHELQQQSCLCDVRLTTEQGGLMAHRLVLMATSPYLRSQLSSRVTSETDSIHFSSIPLSVLETVVSFIYSGRLCVTDASVDQLREFCSYLGLQEAVKACTDVSEQAETEKNQTVASSDETCKSENVVEKVDTAQQGVGMESVSGTKPVASGSSRRVKRTPKKRTLTPTATEAVLDVNSFKEELVAPKQKGARSSPQLTSATKAVVQEIKQHNTRGSAKKVVNTQSKNKRQRSLKKVTDKHVKKPAKSKQERKRRTGKVKPTEVKASDSVTPSDLSTQETNLETSIPVPETGADSDVDDSVSIGDESDSGHTLPVKSDSDNLTNKQVQPESRVKTEKQKKPVGRPHEKNKFPCSVCSRVLTNHRRLVFHEYSRHDIPFDETRFKMYPCEEPECDYIAANNHNLQTHRRSRHGNDRPHICEFCGKGFKLSNVLATHRNIHTHNKVFKCPDCGETFNQQAGLDIHVKRRHIGESSWAELCHLCSEKFLMKSELCWHLFKSHGLPLPDQYKAYTCDLCTYTTKSSQDLERHTNAHKGIKEFNCEICSKKCSTKSELKRHLKFHGEKKFKCGFEGCQYACVDKLGLNKHVKLMHTHKNFKPYICSVCPYRTGVKGNLDKHIRTVHNLEVVTKHTVHLKMKYWNLQSGDIITKDGKLVATAQQRKQEEPFQQPTSLKPENVVANSNAMPLAAMEIATEQEMMASVERAAVTPQGIIPGHVNSPDNIMQQELVISQDQESPQERVIVQPVRLQSVLTSVSQGDTEYATNFLYSQGNQSAMVSQHALPSGSPGTSQSQLDVDPVAQDLRLSLQNQLVQAEMYQLSSGEGGQFVTTKYTQFADM